MTSGLNAYGSYLLALPVELSYKLKHTPKELIQTDFNIFRSVCVLCLSDKLDIRSDNPCGGQLGETGLSAA